MRILKKTHIQFIDFSKTASTISVIIIVIGLISIFALRGLNFSIDFTGGSILQVKFDNELTVADIRSNLGQVGLDKSVIQQTSGDNEFLIRIADSKVIENPRELTKESLSKMGNPFEVLRTEKVGPKIGGELRGKALLAIVSAIFAIGLYISVRFKFMFAIGAVVALIHDVLFTLGIFSFTQLEISLSTIAAFLTIVGYSLNDTIVLYDRVRENIKRNRRLSIKEVVNTSINEVLSRTIITSLTTLAVVIVLSFATGEVQIFAYAMICGVIVGTYSSIYIAGPVVIAWQNKLNKK